MRISWFKAVLLSMLIWMVTDSCKEDKTVFPASRSDSPSKIVLHWYQNDSETREEFVIGMQWCFSYLGASLEEGSWALATRWQNETKIEIDVKELGFNSNAVDQLKKLISLFKDSEEYEETGGIDAGRFVVSIFNNSNHYYKIVDMPSTLDEFIAPYTFLETKAAIIESAVAFDERLIHMPKTDQSINSLAYWALELSGSLLDSTHITEENEVLEVMPNGQIRFGIYNKNKELIQGADSSLSIGGKPSKCQWCHESQIQIGFAALTAVPGYFSPSQFDSIVVQNTRILDNYRSTLSTEIDFSDRSQHTELEMLYIRFMEPSVKRLSAEWGMTENEVESKLSSLTSHKHPEFNELGDLYFRTELQQYAPYDVLPSTDDARETNSYEPNLLP